MNYRSSISFHGTRLSCCPRTWHGCRTQPSPQGGFGPGCLNVPEPLAHRCARKSLLQPFPSGSAPHPCPRSPRTAARGFSSLCCWPRWELEPVREGKDEKQRWSCSFSLNGRDSCSRWHELAYPTYMHLLASRQLRGTNQTSLFWFGGKKKPRTTISVYLSGSGIIH